MRRRGRRHKQLLNDLKEMRGYWKLEVDALITFCGELTLEEAMDLSYYRLWNERINECTYKCYHNINLLVSILFCTSICLSLCECRTTCYSWSQLSVHTVIYTNIHIQITPYIYIQYVSPQCCTTPLKISYQQADRQLVPYFPAHKTHFFSQKM
jgi:hypothetical protein